MRKNNTVKRKVQNKSKKNKTSNVHQLYLLVAVIVVGVLGLVFNARIVSVNSKIITDSFTVQDVSWYEQDSKKAMNAPPVGERYVTVVFGATNKKDSVQWLTPVTQAHIIDVDKKVRTIQLVENNSPFQAGPINPSETRKGELSFLIPTSDSRAGFCFYITADDGGCILLDSSNKIN